VKARLLEQLACPACGSPLRVGVSEVTAGEDLREGELFCEPAGHRWPVRAGIPRLVPSDLPLLQRQTAEAFGWEWTHFVEQHSQFEQQFLDWLYPIEPDFFRGKVVLDAGCGTGRHAYFAAEYGAREVVALELSEAVETAARVLEPFGQAHVVQGDLLGPPLRTVADGGGFDLIYTVGVLHHLPDPQEGFRSLVGYLRPGGTIAVWVYGHENNGFVRHVVEPLRRLTTRMPPSVLRGVAWPLGVAFHAVARGIYRPLAETRVGRALPLGEYLASVADFSFRHNYAIVYDQLAAPTARYIRGEELRSWFADAGLEAVELSHRHGNSWRARGRLPLVPEPGRVPAAAATQTGPP
jgi:SAM-dependent methyltransferase